MSRRTAREEQTRNRAFHVLARMRRTGRTLTAAAREEHIDPRTVRKHIGAFCSPKSVSVSAMGMIQQAIAVYGNFPQPSRVGPASLTVCRSHGFDRSFINSAFGAMSDSPLTQTKPNEATSSSLDPLGIVAMPVTGCR